MVREFVTRILRLLVKFGVIKGMYQVVYKGKGVSLNEYYSSKGWWHRNKIKNEYSDIFHKLIKEAYIEWMDKYAVVIYYNSNHDPDNVVGLSKIFVDEIKAKEKKGKGFNTQGYIKDDSPKYCKFFAIIPDMELDKNTFEFNLIKLS